MISAKPTSTGSQRVSKSQHIPNTNYISAANWPELFFDLVFVVAIVLLSHKLLEAPEISTIGSFLLLFFSL